jgi:hypothetical protein
LTTAAINAGERAILQRLKNAMDPDNQLARLP